MGLLGSGVRAEAATHHSHHIARIHSGHREVAYRYHYYHSHRAYVHFATWHRYVTGAWLECVPYARRVSGIDLRGNADTWWSEADGRYERGQNPAVGAVLSFRSSPRMVFGHVAVVTEAVNQREILVTQANWPTPGQRYSDISKAISVIDVSPDNDWTAVRVELGHSGRYGSVYATNGFIYSHSEPDSLMADASATKTMPALQGTLSGWTETVQLASAPGDGGMVIADSGPDRNLK